MADLIEDSLYDIFSRIPLKSLARFRCVCKQWHKYINEYINDPHLSSIHPHVKEPKLLQNDPIKYSIRFQPVSVLSLLHITMEDTTAAGLIQVKKDSSSIFQVKRSSLYHPYQKIQGYCNGLIALIKQQHNFQNLHNIGPTFVVINPLTKECHELPQLKRPNEIIIGQGLGFDNSINTFKMVCFLEKKRVLTLMGNDDIGSGVLVHVLGTDSWRKIPQVPLYHINGEAVYANGRLYWQTAYPNYSSHIVWLDVKEEEFGVIDLPKQADRCHRLYYPSGPDHEEVEVWILKHEDQWIIHCVVEHPDYSYGRVSVLGCWHQDGDLLVSSAGEILLFVYRLKSGSFHKLIGPDDEDIKAELRMYQSSLFSIRKWH